MGYDAAVYEQTPRGDTRAFAAELETYRKARGLTPAELARAIGASTSQVSRWRRGGGISLDYLQSIADWMGRPLSDLMPLAGYPSPTALAVQSDPDDPDFKAVREAWRKLDRGRKQIIKEIALAGAAAALLLTPR